MDKGSFKKEVREDLDFWLYVISKTTLGLLIPLAEPVKLILLSLWNESKPVSPQVYFQCHFIHIGQALTFNDFLTRRACQVTALDKCCRNV